jgi:hypothetical protein
LKTEATTLSVEGERLRTALEAAQDELKAREGDAARLVAERDAAQAQTQALLARIGQPTQKGPQLCIVPRQFHHLEYFDRKRPKATSS